MCLTNTLYGIVNRCISVEILFTLVRDVRGDSAQMEFLLWRGNCKLEFEGKRDKDAFSLLKRSPHFSRSANMALLALGSLEHGSTQSLE